MANRRNFGSDDESNYVESNYQNNSDVISCKILDISKNRLHLYFNGYGIQVPVPKDKTYKIGDMVKIGYNGTIGTSNFKKWVVN